MRLYHHIEQFKGEPCKHGIKKKGCENRKAVTWIPNSSWCRLEPTGPKILLLAAAAPLYVIFFSCCCSWTPPFVFIHILECSIRPRQNHLIDTFSLHINFSRFTDKDIKNTTQLIGLFLPYLHHQPHHVQTAYSHPIQPQHHTTCSFVHIYSFKRYKFETSVGLRFLLSRRRWCIV